MEPRFELIVERYKSDTESTLSRIWLVDLITDHDELLCHGCEDGHRAQKIPGETRIPPGKYEIGLRRVGGFHTRYGKLFPKFHRGMIHVQNVPGFEYILWHIGNTHRDTDGCLLLGQADEVAMAVWSSKKTYYQVYARLEPLISEGLITHVEYLDKD